MNNIIKTGYYLELKKNARGEISESLVNRVNDRKVVVPNNKINYFCNSFIIKNNLNQENKIIVNYSSDTDTYLAAIKRENDETIVCLDGTSYDEAISKLTDYLVWFCPDYERVHDDIDRRLDASYGLLLTDAQIGYFRDPKDKIIDLKKQEKLFFSMFSKINYELHTNKNMFLTVNKENEEYTFRIADLTRPEDKIIVTSNDLVAGLSDINQNIRKEKGKILCKKHC